MKILVPISIAELYDKISILEIKKERISDADKLKNINNELIQLLEISIEYPISDDLYSKLKEINSVIWDLEEKIRRDGNVNIAIHIHFSNDKRSALKRNINLKYKSDIIEEKSY